jgi:hypothetical protein
VAGRYDNPIPPRFLAPIDCLKIPARCSNFGVMTRRPTIDSTDSIPPT